VPHEAAQ